MLKPYPYIGPTENKVSYLLFKILKVVDIIAIH